MTVQLKTSDPLPPSILGAKRRPAWRQRLVEAERGFAQGFRTDSTLFVHFFAGSIVVAAGLILGLTMLQWALIVLSSSVVIAAEMFHKALLGFMSAMDESVARAAAPSRRMATAAVFVTMLGTAIILALTFGQRIAELAGR